MKKRNLIILVVISLIIIASAVLIPEVLWNRHIRQLTLANYTRTYEMPENFHIPNSKELSENIRTGRIWNHENRETDRVQNFETAKQALSSFFEFCESEETLKYRDDILNTSNLEYTVTNINSVLSDSVPQYYSFLTATITHYFGDLCLFIDLIYEQKTQTIVSLSVFIDPKKDFYLDVFFDDFMSAASKYYASCGIDPEYIESYYDKSTFYMSIKTPENNYVEENDYDEKYS